MRSQPMFGLMTTTSPRETKRFMPPMRVERALHELGGRRGSVRLFRDGELCKMGVFAEARIAKIADLPGALRLRDVEPAFVPNQTTDCGARSERSRREARAHEHVAARGLLLVGAHGLGLPCGDGMRQVANLPRPCKPHDCAANARYVRHQWVGRWLHESTKRRARTPSSSCANATFISRPHRTKRSSPK